MVHTVKDISILSEAEVDVFLEFPCLLYEPANTGDLISGSSAFSFFFFAVSYITFLKILFYF